MSWSANAIGKPAAVAAKLKADLSAYKCHEPEETIKTKVSEIIETSLKAMPAGVCVKVTAFGSQSVPDSTRPEVATNSVTLTIEPMHGFLE